MAKTSFELDKLRRQHLGAITQVSDLEWFRVPLAGGATIEVSYPYAADELWIPVTAQEQWTLASKLRVFPLTRAVADQAHMKADNGSGAEKYLAGSYGLDFEASSQQVNLQRRYSTFYGWQAISGVHKVWLLSNGPYPPGDPKAMAVNYGFYTQARTKVKNDGGGVLGGKYLKDWYVVQDPGTAHNKNFWDYSQLLQFMKNYTPGGEPEDLRAAILKGDSAVWDEPSKLRPDLLPF